MAKREIVLYTIKVHLLYVTGSPGVIPVCLYSPGIPDTLQAPDLTNSTITIDRLNLIELSLNLPLIT